ncbi:uncharacterized protein LOC128551207 [Mercenaria mercenaria]|uniref:uncharacterized protein LOC128551207 n=1 Tax=Mercenaria mercenaria TaxID=6596 RepID=UPI00234F904E|nr:uncharacterized protein LOC128551207 [Mercenaria mercenaria]
MTMLLYCILLTLIQTSVFCHEIASIEALVTRIDALEKAAERQKNHIQSQEETIKLLRINDEQQGRTLFQQQRRIEELEQTVKVQQKIINDVISRAKNAESQVETADAASDAVIKANLETVAKPVDVSETNMSQISGVEQIRKSLNFPRKSSTRQTPETVAFHATIDVQNHVTQLTQGQTIVFNSVHFNVGGGYHSSAGLFIAPSAGIYMFSLSVMLNTGTGSWISLELIKNGAVLAEAYAFQYDQGSVTVATQLKIGDEVFVKVHASNIGMLYGETLTSFMGALLMHL